MDKLCVVQIPSLLCSDAEKFPIAAIDEQNLSRRISHPDQYRRTGPSRLLNLDHSNNNDRGSFKGFFQPDSNLPSLFAYKSSGESGVDRTGSSNLLFVAPRANFFCFVPIGTGNRIRNARAITILCSHPQVNVHDNEIPKMGWRISGTASNHRQPTMRHPKPRFFGARICHNRFLSFCLHQARANR